MGDLADEFHRAVDANARQVELEAWLDAFRVTRSDFLRPVPNEYRDLLRQYVELAQRRRPLSKAWLIPAPPFADNPLFAHARGVVQPRRAEPTISDSKRFTLRGRVRDLAVMRENHRMEIAEAFEESRLETTAIWQDIGAREVPYVLVREVAGDGLNKYDGEIATILADCTYMQGYLDFSNLKHTLLVNLTAGE